MDRIWTAISVWHTCRKHSVDTLIFKYEEFDRHHDEHERKCTHTHLTRRGERNAFEECHTSSIEEKILKLIGEEFKYEDSLHCLHRRRCKTRFEICENEDGELSDIRAIRRHSDEIVFPSRLTNYVMFHHNWGDTHTHRRVCHTKKGWHREEIHTLIILKEGTHTLLSYVDQARDQYSIAKAGLVTGEKERKEENHTIFSPTTMQTKQKNLQISRSRGRWIIKFIEDLNQVQSTEFYCPWRRNEFWQTASTPSLSTSLHWKNAAS